MKSIQEFKINEDIVDIDISNQILEILKNVPNFKGKKMCLFTQLGFQEVPFSGISVDVYNDVIICREIKNNRIEGEGWTLKFEEIQKIDKKIKELS